MDYFAQQRDRIGPFLAGWLRDQAPRYGFMAPWGGDVLARLEEFGLHGKMIRGGLTLLGHELWGGARDADALRCAAAMELFQAGFLIHDDIMDRDRVRRGRPSIFMQYARRAEDEGLHDPYHQGESLGICAGDIALFLGFELLSVPDSPPDYTPFCVREIVGVGLAQMQDVWAGAAAGLPERERILALYTHKTGRYSFSLPLMAGSMLAGKRESELGALSRLGELMGLVFQIRDDELGLFGDEAALGKPIGSDIREGKKTLYWRTLLDSLPAVERLAVEAHFGQEDVSPDAVAGIRDLMVSTGARARVAEFAAGLRDEAASIIAGLPVSAEHRAILGRLLAFISSRDH